MITVDINEVYEFVRFVVNKTVLHFGPDRFNLAFNQAQRQLFKDRYGRPEDYRLYDKQRVAYELSQKIHDDLAPFKSNPTQINILSGVGTFPDDYVHPLAFRSVVQLAGTPPTSEERAVRIVDEDKLGNRLGSKVRKPTLGRPIVVLYSTTVKVYPAGTSSLLLTYLKYPVDARWAYTTVNSRPVYNSAGSTQPQWRKINQNDLIIRTCGFFGINLKAGQVEQYAQLKQQEGI